YLSAPPTTEIYTLSLHDALPISRVRVAGDDADELVPVRRDHREQPVLQRVEVVTALDGDVVEVDHRLHVDGRRVDLVDHAVVVRSEEHTSELQSQSNLVCRLLLE